MALNHWLYYLSIEEDVLRTQRYVEIAEENFPTHSIEFTRLLLATGSEIDVMCKQLCHEINPVSDPKNINHYHDIIAARYPKIRDFEVWPVRWNFHWKPWADWQNGTPPQWWSDHNKVKHQRYEHYALASLENVLESLCGLHIINLFYSRAKGEIYDLEPSRLTPHFFKGGAAIHTYHRDDWFE